MRISPSNPFRRKGRTLRLSLTVLAAIATAASAIEPDTAVTDDGFDALPALSPEELQELRGGFEYAGLQFDFAAFLRTFVDGRLALETIIKYTDGTLTQHNQPLPGTIIGGGITAPVTGTGNPSTPSAPSTSGAGQSVQVLGGGQGPSPAQLNLPGIDLSGLKDAAGILISDRGGAILALHEATREGITSLVVNQASGQDIRQELNIDVTVENFRQFQEALRGTILNNRIGTTTTQY